MGSVRYRLLLRRQSGLSWFARLGSYILDHLRCWKTTQLASCNEWENNGIGERECAKHINIRKHYAHEAIQLGHVRLVRVSTADQFADILTRGLQPLQHCACIWTIEQRPRPS
jgi:hypothetical protein